MKDAKQLEKLANQNRKHIVEMVYRAGVGHVGGALSVIDILTAIYENEVDFREKERTRVVLSKDMLYRQFMQNCQKKVSLIRHGFLLFGKLIPDCRVILSQEIFRKRTVLQGFWDRVFPRRWVWH